MRCLPETTLENHYLKPSFPDNKTTIMFAAGSIYYFHTKLIPIRQRTERELESARDRLGMNLVQYCQVSRSSRSWLCFLCYFGYVMV